MKIETTTKTGVKVELDYDGKGSISSCHVLAHHPKVGKIEGRGSWKTLNGDEGVVLNTMIGKKRANVCMTIPKADYLPIEKAIEEAKQAEKETELKIIEDNKRLALEECPAGFTIAQANWQSGDSCMGEYETEKGIKVLASDLLENHHGWYFIPVELVEEKVSEIKKANEKKIAAEKAANKRVTGVFEKAEETGKKQVLNTFQIDCTDHREECNMDIVTVWAMPDGTKTETKVHTW